MVGFKISEFLLNFTFMLNIISNSSYLWEKEKPDCCMTRLSPLKFYSEFFSNIGKWANEIRHCITGLSCHTVTDENAFSRKKKEPHFYNIVTHLVTASAFSAGDSVGVLHWNTQHDQYIYTPTTWRFYRGQELGVLMGVPVKNQLPEKELELFNPQWPNICPLSCTVWKSFFPDMTYLELTKTPKPKHIFPSS